MSVRAVAVTATVMAAAKASEAAGIDKEEKADDDEKAGCDCEREANDESIELKTKNIDRNTFVDCCTHQPAGKRTLFPSGLGIP